MTMNLRQKISEAMKQFKWFFRMVVGAVTMFYLTMLAAGRLVIGKCSKKGPKRRKIAFGIMGGIIVLLVVGGIVRNVVEEYDRRYGRVEYFDRYLSQSVRSVAFRDGTCRVYDLNARRYTTDKLEWVADAPLNDDSLTVFSCNNKRGYINVNNGEIVIPEQYSKAWVFSEGVGAVLKNGKIGFVNAENETIIPFNYDYADRNGMPIDYLFRDGYCVMTDSRGACGVIDHQGKWVVEPQYDCIWTPHGKYRIVKDGDKYGLFDDKFDFVFPIEYDYIQFAPVGVFLTKDGCKSHVNFDGTVIQPFVCDYFNVLYRDSLVYEGNENYDTESRHVSVETDYYLYTVNGKMGVLRKEDKKVVIPAKYNDITMSGTDVFSALTDNGVYVIFDKDGNQIGSEPVWKRNRRK